MSETRESSPLSSPYSVPSPTPSRTQSPSPSSRYAFLPGPIRRNKAYDLSRDTRIQILTLHNIAKWNMNKIAKALGITYNQVRTAVTAGHPTPQKRRGRSPILSQEQIDEIEAFVCQSRRTRRMAYRALTAGMNLNYELLA